MTKIIEKTGATIDAAVESALKELDCSREDVEIEILNKGSKGFLGLGVSEAKVRVTLIKEDVVLEDISEENNTDVEKYLLNILEKMGINAELDVKEEEGKLDIEISGDLMGVVIGRRGDTLDSLQYLCSLVYNKNREDYVRVNLDTENYRAKREETLVNLAKKIAGTVSRTGRSITLEPMNPNERRIIHSTLQSYDYINTYSIGEDPNRKIVVSSKNSSRSPRGGYRRNYSSYKREEIKTATEE
ncbi:MAG: RNA-binding cell elongation regulator Jag/EloR [Clostridia bacterium]